MRLRISIPRVERERVRPPEACPHCGKKCLNPHQVRCRKPIRDTKWEEVVAQRWKGLRCKR